MLMDAGQCAEFLAQTRSDGPISANGKIVDSSSCEDKAEPASQPSLFSFLIRPLTVRRALKVSGVVGTTLLLINQGDVVFAGQPPVLWKAILTYITPFAVSSYSTASLLREQAR